MMVESIPYSHEFMQGNDERLTGRNDDINTLPSETTVRVAAYIRERGKATLSEAMHHIGAGYGLGQSVLISLTSWYPIYEDGAKGRSLQIGWNYDIEHFAKELDLVRHLHVRRILIRCRTAKVFHH